MKTHTLLASCLVLGTSSAAMADSFHVQAHVQARVPAYSPAYSTVNAGYRFDGGAAVRDHRIAPAPARFVAYGSARPIERERFARPGIRVALPPVTGPTWDCHNWDPTVELSSVCAAYASGQPEAVPAASDAGILLGVRDAAIPDHQYITVGAGQPFRQLVIEGNDGAPEISRVAIKFMDGSTEVVGTQTRLRDGRSLAIALDGGTRQINQIVLYTPYGAHGSYAVFGR